MLTSTPTIARRVSLPATIRSRPQRAVRRIARRIPVITACGMIAPQSANVEEFWKMVRAGASAITSIRRFDASQLACTIGGEVPEFDLGFIHPSFKPRRMARHTLLLLEAARQVRHLCPKLPPSRMAIRVGLATSCLDMICESGVARERGGLDAVSKFMITQSPPHAAVGTLTHFLGLSCDVQTISNACAAGLDAIGAAASMIRNDEADCVITGGSDSALGVSPLAEFIASGLASLRNNVPSLASRPFDTFADSGVLSEGGVVLIVEERSAALARGMPILAEIVGHTVRNDPDRTRPGSGYAPCMQAALELAKMDTWQIDTISAWAPGHPVLDRAEADAIREVFQEQTLGIPITSIKGVVGNPLAAAGPMQVVAAIKAMQEGIVPPIANHEIPLAGCELDYVTGRPRHSHPEVTLINAHGVGGGNSTLLLRRC
ncbi:MAG: beta-ketoacyl synthase [Candidatus Methylacidiphilales bacterium]|nr:beta-ketoacyl-[acyl-carrier-protein] synthase family protein [Candidatus Methylacidiphilales bacterium]